MALVACSALSALSLAAQGLANVRRDHQLVGPVSLYLLAVAALVPTALGALMGVAGLTALPIHPDTLMKLLS